MRPIGAIFESRDSCVVVESELGYYVNKNTGITAELTPAQATQVVLAQYGQLGTADYWEKSVRN